jgi:ATP-dependent protease HslVU (ClpYQ) peptidase subunit
MTCIAGIESGGKVWIGGDSAGVSDSWTLWVRADSKVFRNGDFIMGFTTSFRMGQLLRYAFSPPAFPEGEDLDKFMATTFIDAVRGCLVKGGFAKKNSEQEEGGEFLVGYGSKLFAVFGDYQVARCSSGIAAIGCGGQIALGALYAAPDLKPEARLLKALEAAESFNAGVRRPFIIESTGNNQ